MWKWWLVLPWMTFLQFDSNKFCHLEVCSCHRERKKHLSFCMFTFNSSLYSLSSSTPSPPYTQMTAEKLRKWRRRRGERRGSIRLVQKVRFSRHSQRYKSYRTTPSPLVGEWSKKSLKMISAFPSTPSVCPPHPCVRRSRSRSADTGMVETWKKGW